MSVADWKEREKEQRRNDIIGAAHKLFASNGYENVSMDDIAEEIKLGKATLYRYFKSKESLFYAVVLRGVRIQYGMVMKALKNARTGSERLAAVGDTSIEFKKKCPEYDQINGYYYSGRFDLCGLMNYSDADCPEDRRVDRATLLEISQLRAEMFDTMCTAIAAGREDGTIKPGLDPVELAFLLSLISSSLINLSPEYKCLMEYKGIDYDRFKIHARHFINQNLRYQ